MLLRCLFLSSSPERRFVSCIPSAFSFDITRRSHASSSFPPPPSSGFFWSPPASFLPPSLIFKRANCSLSSSLPSSEASSSSLSKITLEEATKKLTSLTEDLKKHNHLYYSQASPIISDHEYDVLRKTLEELLLSFPDLKIYSKREFNEAQKQLEGVGVPPSSEDTAFHHTIPMLSLDNIFKEHDIADFVGKIFKMKDSASPSNDSHEVIVEPKVDGVSLCLRYSNGNLIGAGTRGDGHTGIDVTQKAKKMKSIPQHVPQLVSLKAIIASIPTRPTLPYDRDSEQDPLMVEVRGEAFLETSDFLSMDNKTEGETTVSGTPRNKAAGILRQKSTKNAGRLRFFAYSLHILPSMPTDYPSSPLLEQSAALTADIFGYHSCTLDFLQKAGFVVACDENRRSFSFSRVDDHTPVEQIASFAAHCENMVARRNKLPFETDGLVIKVNDLRLQALMGNRARSPKWAIAFKFTAKVYETTLKDFSVQVGRTGVLTPVAILEPVNIGGVVVSRATLHNETEIRRLNLYPGAKVEITRAGDVIPKITGLAEEKPDASSQFQMPSICPVCGSQVISEHPQAKKTKANQSAVPESPRHWCSGGAHCSAQAVEKIKHFASKDALNIRGLGPKSIEQLYNAGILRNLNDIFDIENSLDTLESLRGWKKTSIEKLIASIENSRNNVTMDRFLYGLGIPNIGIYTAKSISKEFNGDMGKFMAALEGEKPLEEVFTSLTASVLYSLQCISADSARMNELRALQQSLRWSHERSSAVSTKEMVHDSPWRGKELVFTGKLSAMSRSTAEAIWKQLGGVVRSRVSPSTDILVAGESHGTMSAKQKEFEKLDKPIWSEDDWNRICQQYYESDSN